MATLTDLRSDTGNATAYTFTACNIGGAVGGTSILDATNSLSDVPSIKASSKMLIVIVHAEDAATLFNVSTVSIGGVNGTAEQDRGGGISAINTSIFSFSGVSLQNISNTDIVVTMSEAITGCVISVVLIDNVSFIGKIAAGVTTQAGTSTLDLSAGTYVGGNSTRLGHYACSICATTCATGGGTEHVVFDPTGAAGFGGASPPSNQPQLLYEGNNAEFDYAALFVVTQQYFQTEIGVAESYIDWSGAGAADGIIVAFQ